jgi:hypothetical protein
LAFAAGAVIRYGISMGARWLFGELVGRRMTIAAARTRAAESDVGLFCILGAVF